GGRTATHVPGLRPMVPRTWGATAPMGVTPADVHLSRGDNVPVTSSQRAPAATLRGSAEGWPRKLEPRSRGEREDGMAFAGRARLDRARPRISVTRDDVYQRPPPPERKPPPLPRPPPLLRGAEGLASSTTSVRPPSVVP